MPKKKKDTKVKYGGPQYEKRNKNENNMKGTPERGRKNEK